MYVQVHLQTFAIRAAEMVQGLPMPAARVPGNHAWIDFDGPPGTYRTYSMADVLAGTVPALAFAGKIVLVGITAPIGKDVFTTSASSKPMSGVEVQANSIETVLRGFPLRSSNPILGVALIIALALAPVLLSLRVSSLLVGLSSIALVVLFLGAAELAFAHGLILRRLDNPKDWVRLEVEKGLARPEVAVVPVLVDGATMPASSDLPSSLRPLSDREAFVLAVPSLDEVLHGDDPAGGQPQADDRSGHRQSEPRRGGRCARRRYTTKSASPAAAHRRGSASRRRR